MIMLCVGEFLQKIFFKWTASLNIVTLGMSDEKHSRIALQYVATFDDFDIDIFIVRILQNAHLILQIAVWMMQVQICMRHDFFDITLNSARWIRYIARDMMDEWWEFTTGRECNRRQMWIIWFVEVMNCLHFQFLLFVDNFNYFREHQTENDRQKSSNHRIVHVTDFD